MKMGSTIKRAPANWQGLVYLMLVTYFNADCLSHWIGNSRGRLREV